MNGRERYEEIVIATNPTLEGEATAMYIAERIAGQVGAVSRIARGSRWVATSSTPMR